MTQEILKSIKFKDWPIVNEIIFAIFCMSLISTIIYIAFLNFHGVITIEIPQNPVVIVTMIVGLVVIEVFAVYGVVLFNWTKIRLLFNSKLNEANKLLDSIEG